MIYNLDQIKSKLDTLLKRVNALTSKLNNLSTSEGGGSISVAETGTSIKNKLQTLTGTNRLDASAIQNLPTATVDLSNYDTKAQVNAKDAAILAQTYVSLTYATYADALSAATGTQKKIITVATDENSGGSMVKYFYEGVNSVLEADFDILDETQFERVQIGGKFVTRLKQSFLDTLGGNTPQTQLATPTVSFGTTAQTTQVVNWTTVTNATSYTVKRNTSNTQTGATTIYTGNLLTFSDTGLTASTTYYYFVTATAPGYTSSNAGTGDVTTSAVGGSQVPVTDWLDIENITLTGNTFSFTNAQGWGYGRSHSATYIASGTDGNFTMDLPTAVHGVLIVSNTNDNPSNGNAPYSIHFNGANGKLNCQIDGVTQYVNTGVITPSNNVKIRFRFASSTAYIEYSTDNGSTWTEGNSGARPSGNLYVKVWADEANQQITNITKG